VAVVAPPSAAVLSVEAGLRRAGASVVRTTPRRGTALRADDCDIAVVRIEHQRSGTALPQNPRSLLPPFKPDRMLALLDEPAQQYVALVADFVLPPFRSPEVVARVSRMLLPARAEVTLRAGNLELHTASRTATVGGQAVDLTFHEFEILRLLLAANGSVLSRHDMVRHLAHGGTPDSRWADIHIHRLRTKLSALERASIETVRGVGYRLSRQR
jgi:DNA-binding winged helix-turn-helix (wHTH) protein